MAGDVSKYPRVTLIVGDPYLGLNKVLEIKRERFPDGPSSAEWIEFEAPPAKARKAFMKDGLNAMDAEISSPDWEGQHKVIYLRGLIDTKEFRPVISKFVKVVAEGNTFLIFDEDEVLAKDADGNWKEFRKACEAAGKILDVGMPLSRFTQNQQIGFIVNEMAKRSKNITRPAAFLLLEMMPPERSYVIPEMDKLAAVVDGVRITEDDIRRIVFPMATEYEIWKFYDAFNSGSYKRIMMAAERLVENGWERWQVMQFCVRMARWHVVAAHMVSYNSDAKKSLVMFSKPPDEEECRRKLMARPEIPRRAFADWTEEGAKEKVSKERGLQPRTADDVLSFVRGPLHRAASREFPNNPSGGTRQMAMRRFLSLKEAFVDMRLSDHSEAALIFETAIRMTSLQ